MRQDVVDSVWWMAVARPRHYPTTADLRKPLPRWWRSLSRPSVSRALPSCRLPSAVVLSVPEAGLEPARSCPQWILSPSRLPIPPLRQAGECSGWNSPQSEHMFAGIIEPMGNRIETKLFRLNERIIEIRQQESRTSAELDMLRALDDDFQRDAAVSGHAVDRADAQRAHADVERFERVLADLAARRDRLETQREALLARLDGG